MKKFMLLYLAPASAVEQMMATTTPEEMKKGMEPWMAWYAKHGNAIVDAGTPLVNGIHFHKTESSKTKSPVSGYSIVQAEDMDTVKRMVSDHPHYMMPEGSIEVFEMMPMAM
jgi:hypothetical protein